MPGTRVTIGELLSQATGEVIEHVAVSRRRRSPTCRREKKVEPTSFIIQPVCEKLLYLHTAMTKQTGSIARSASDISISQTINSLSPEAGGWSLRSNEVHPSLCLV